MGKKLRELDDNQLYFGKEEEEFWREQIRLEKERKLKLKIEKLNELFKKSERLSVEAVAKTLEMSKNELFEFLLTNGKSLGEIRFLHGKLYISSKRDVTEFIKILDNQFKIWEIGEKTKEK